MQGLWKKVGAALGSAVMIGATLAGAALAQTKTLGDYKDLVIASDGSVTGMYVVGANAATADVITAMGMTAWLGNQQVAGGGAGTGQITLTPISTTVQGVKRHVEIDNTADNALEFGATTGNDTIGPSGYASGDGVVEFLYSYNEKGPIYVNGTEYQWHEEVTIDNAKVSAIRDDLESADADKYDEIFLSVGSGSMTYKFKMDKALPFGDFKGKKIWFMGKEYTVISATSSTFKLGSSDAEVVLTTSNPTTTIEGVDVTLGGIYSAGTAADYKAKITVTNGGTTETKYVTSGATETIAGIEVYVKNAVVTTIGTNEGEAQLVVGAGILKLLDGDYLKKGDGTETSWMVGINSDGSGNLDYLAVTETQSHTAITGDYPVLKPGDSIMAPNGLFGLTYNGLTDQYGNDVVYRTINIQPQTRNFGTGEANQPSIRIRTPDEAYIEFTYSGVTKIDKEIWIPVNESNTFYYRDTTVEPNVYRNVSNPKIKLTTGKDMRIYWTKQPKGASAEGLPGYLNLDEPTLSEANTAGNITIEYNNSKFQSINSTDGYYAYYSAWTETSPGGDTWFGRHSNYTTATRDYYTKFGTYVSTVGPYLITLKVPEGQTYAEYVIGTQQTGTGEAKTVSPGETVTIGGTEIKVEGTVTGQKPVTLPSTVSKVDADVTSADKAAYTLVLIGGPAVNTLVNQLQTEGKLEKTIGSPGSDADIASAGAGVIELVEDAWGTGKYAIVVAGSDREGTNKAGNILANFDDYASELSGKTVYTV